MTKILAEGLFFCEYRQLLSKKLAASAQTGSATVIIGGISLGLRSTIASILIVAADDGIMPQTVEAINHIKSANIPMIVAINKMDKPHADPDRVMTQLAEHNVLPEAWGGDAIICKISAHTGEGIDKLLLTKLVQARKYKCLDRDEYDTAAREQGFGAKVEIIPAGYSMSGEIVQLLKSGKSRAIAGTTRDEYVATVSIRANDLRTQQPYEADTIRVTAYCQTPKDMLVHVVKRMAVAILMRDYPPYIMDYDEDDEDITVSYGGDFLSVGEQYEVRRRREIVDDDTGDVVYKEKTTGVLEIVDVSKNTSTAKLLSGKAKKKDVLRFYDNADSFSPVAAALPVSKASADEIKPVSVFPKKRCRIAVAPFMSKQNIVNVRGLRFGARNWMDDVADHLNMSLAKRSNFKVLDRSFGPEIDRELNRIVNDPNANPNDVCRLSNKLAADYLVVAEVVFSDVRFRCVAAPTTEIVWADKIMIDSKYFGGTAEQFSSTSAGFAADMIADQIQKRLDPDGFEKLMKERDEQRRAAEDVLRALPRPAVKQQSVPQLF